MRAWLTWFQSRFVFASVGYGPGVALYLIFGVAAGFSGWILWQVFLTLDSSRYPMLSFGDTYFRVFGQKSRHFINFAQALCQGVSHVICPNSGAPFCDSSQFGRPFFCK
jgi:hypothetical protein